jgi:hypothetical protein
LSSRVLRQSNLAIVSMSPRTFMPTLQHVQTVAESFMLAADLPIFTEMYDAVRHWAQLCFSNHDCDLVAYLGGPVIRKFLGISERDDKPLLMKKIRAMSAEQSRINSLILSYQLDDMFAL